MRERREKRKMKKTRMELSYETLGNNLSASSVNNDNSCLAEGRCEFCRCPTTHLTTPDRSYRDETHNDRKRLDCISTILVRAAATVSLTHTQTVDKEIKFGKAMTKAVGNVSVRERDSFIHVPPCRIVPYCTFVQ